MLHSETRKESINAIFRAKIHQFDHISKDDEISKHTTTFARELIACGSNNTAILLNDCTIFIFRKVLSTRSKDNHTVSIKVVP